MLFFLFGLQEAASKCIVHAQQLYHNTYQGEYTPGCQSINVTHRSNSRGTVAMIHERGDRGGRDGDKRLAWRSEADGKRGKTPVIMLVNAVPPPERDQILPQRPMTSAPRADTTEMWSETYSVRAP